MLFFFPHAHHSDNKNNDFLWFRWYFGFYRNGFFVVFCIRCLRVSFANESETILAARERKRERDKRMISLCRSFVVSVVWSEMLVLDAVVTDRVCECLFFLFLRSSILINNIPWIFCSDSICLCVYLNALSHSICW